MPDTIYACKYITGRLLATDTVRYLPNLAPEVSYDMVRLLPVPEYVPRKMNSSISISIGYYPKGHYVSKQVDTA